MIQKLDVGNYHVQVAGYQGAWSAKMPYRLKLDKSGPAQRKDR